MPESSFDRARTYTLDEWRAEAVRRFGPVEDGNWSFECPMCGHVQSPASIKADGRGDPNRAYSECYGRGTRPDLGKGRGKNRTPGDCDWKAYGLIAGPVTVTMPDGTVAHAFDFAPSVAAVASRTGEG